MEILSYRSSFLPPGGAAAPRRNHRQALRSPAGWYSSSATFPPQES